MQVVPSGGTNDGWDLRASVAPCLRFIAALRLTMLVCTSRRRYMKAQPPLPCGADHVAQFAPPSKGAL